MGWRHFRPPGSRSTSPILASDDSMQVSEFLVGKVETAGPETPIRELAHRMRELAIGFIPIVEGDRLVGVITDRDIALRGNPRRHRRGTRCRWKSSAASKTRAWSKRGS